jgi:hypothetical protein
MSLSTIVDEVVDVRPLTLEPLKVDVEISDITVTTRLII